MNIIMKSSSGISLIPLESRLLYERKIFIEGEITSSSACDFVRAIMTLVKDNAEKPIDIYINSPGGEVNAGLLIYDTLKGIETEVNLHCIGLAASMAAIILAGGKNPSAQQSYDTPAIDFGRRRRQRYINSENRRVDYGNKTALRKAPCQ